MALSAWTRGLLDRTLADLRERLDRAFDSMGAQIVPAVENVELEAGPNLVPHFRTGGTPRSALVQLKGSSVPGGNAVAVGAIDARFVALYADADCTVDLYVVN